MRTPAAAIVGAAMLWAVSGLAQTGHWEGKIQIPEHELPITVDLARNAKGVWIGSMTVVGSSSVDVPLEKLAVDGTAVRFAAALPEKASFEAAFSADGETLAGKASNAQGTAPFQLNRKSEADVKVPPPSSAMSKDFEGAWEGAIERNGNTVRVGLKLAAAADGAATATLISRNTEIPASTVIIDGKQLRLEVRAISGTYHGALAADEIKGDWSERGRQVPLTFKRTAPDQ